MASDRKVSRPAAFEGWEPEPEDPGARRSFDHAVQTLGGGDVRVAMMTMLCTWARQRRGEPLGEDLAIIANEVMKLDLPRGRR